MPKPVVDVSEDGLSVVVYTLVPVLCLAVVIIAVYWFYRHRKLAYFNEVPCTSFVVLCIHGLSKMFGERYQKTNKTEDTNKLTLLAFKTIAILHNAPPYGGNPTTCDGCSAIDS
jgi:hypothetical protein